MSALTFGPCIAGICSILQQTDEAKGGKPGQNQKGLVTFDRKTRKDAFFIYKAYLSNDPFVHVCGRRYVDRAEAVTEVKVYSNQSSVTLYVDGKEFASQTADKIFTFHIPLTGEHTIEARSGQCSDSISIRRTEAPNPAYYANGGPVVNWSTNRRKSPGMGITPFWTPWAM